VKILSIRLNLLVKKQEFCNYKQDENELTAQNSEVEKVKKLKSFSFSKSVYSKVL
jgi:hypothetical protein